ncbi:MAG: VOC family protein, partial [Betaproteobacteria bacterium]
MSTQNDTDTLAPKARATHSAKPASRGVHHLALNTSDMKMTIDFYSRVMGMPLIHALRVPPGVGAGPLNRGNPPYENLRHYFFDAGG